MFANWIIHTTVLKKRFGNINVSVTQFSPNMKYSFVKQLVYTYPWQQSLPRGLEKVSAWVCPYVHLYMPVCIWLRSVAFVCDLVHGRVAHHGFPNIYGTIYMNLYNTVHSNKNAYVTNIECDVCRRIWSSAQIGVESSQSSALRSSKDLTQHLAASSECQVDPSIARINKWITQEPRGIAEYAIPELNLIRIS